MTKQKTIKTIEEAFDKEFATTNSSAQVTLVNCELPLDTPLILKRNPYAADRIGYEELGVSVKQFIRQEISKLLEGLRIKKVYASMVSREGPGYFDGYNAAVAELDKKINEILK